MKSLIDLTPVFADPVALVVTAPTTSAPSPGEVTFADAPVCARAGEAPTRIASVATKARTVFFTIRPLRRRCPLTP